MPFKFATSTRMPVRRLGSALAIAAMVVLAGCSGATDASDLGTGTAAGANAPLVHNDPYPNVADDPSRAATAPRSTAEVRRIEDRMMSLAAERGSNSRATPQPASVVEQMKALAKRNRSIANGEDVPPADEPTGALPTN